jgi:transcriptional antiterminator
LHNLNWPMHNFKIEERRRKITSLLAQSMTESEIAQELGVDQSTISRDIKALKELSQQFVYDLAKSDLVTYLVLLFHLLISLFPVLLVSRFLLLFVLVDCIFLQNSSPIRHKLLGIFDRIRTRAHTRVCSIGYIWLAQ